jgi:hypothetical protein
VIVCCSIFAGEGGYKLELPDDASGGAAVARAETLFEREMRATQATAAAAVAAEHAALRDRALPLVSGVRV